MHSLLTDGSDGAQSHIFSAMYSEFKCVADQKVTE